VRSARIVQIERVRHAQTRLFMIDRSSNLLGAVALAVADRIEEAARAVLNRAGETPAALVVIGYGLGPSNDQLRRILRLSHPGSVRLVDRLVADGLVVRREGRDKRAVALHLTRRGSKLREQLLKGQCPSNFDVTDRARAGRTHRASCEDALCPRDHGLGAPHNLPPL
jgi:DNA-binding MarR family transcriptional regulator